MGKKLLNFFFSKIMIVAYLIIIQLLFLFGLIFFLSSYSSIIRFILSVLSILMVIYIFNKDENPSYKLAWISVILILPLFGGIMYLMFGGQKVPRQLRRQLKITHEGIAEQFNQNEQLMEKIYAEDKEAYKQAHYLLNNSGFPVYENTETTFLKSGSVYYHALMKELSSAEKFIFMEYFILEEGFMWNTVLEVMAQKVKEGVDVRLMFDDVGCITKLETDYALKIKELGIKCKVFNPIRARLAMQMNNRDHRKISVIDGKAAFTGGINLADEYMNLKTVYGYWRDQGIMIKGDAVYNFTLMFLQFWDYGEKTFSDYASYYVPTQNKSDGYVQPFSDSPTDGESVGENVHLNIIHSAHDYIYIQTPYLILDDNMREALQLAAKCGVDVRIIVPHIPDKKLVFQVTRANYRFLLKSGVRIYEYTPGFVHAKTILVDDKMGVIGSINFDYRSYYLHFECGVWMYQSSALKELKEDFEKTLNECEEITYEKYMQASIFVRIFRSILSLFAPLM